MPLKKTAKKKIICVGDLREIILKNDSQDLTDNGNEMSDWQEVAYKYYEENR